MIEQIENLPEVSFIDDIKLGNVQANLISFYKEKYKELTKQECNLKRTDPVALILYACSVQLFHTLLYVDRAGKLDLLKYAYDGFLDNLAALKGITRLPATPAVVTMRFTLSEEQEDAISIPQGTRVTNGSVYFATDNYAEIPSGSLFIDVPCTCQTVGEDGNEIGPGGIAILTDPIPFVAFVVNIDESSGGADIENDEDLAERIYLAPSAYSTAGPIDAYEYHVRSYSGSIGSVRVLSPAPCEVEIYVLLEDGTIPTQRLLDDILEFISSDDKRPLTDHVQVLAPGTVEFDIDVKYWINASDAKSAISIQGEVADAIQEYIEWQTTEVGIDINPSELESRIMEAGAKRVQINSPVFTVVGDTSVARIREQTLTYGGIEDD